MDFVTLQPGDVINGKYELLDKLGAGAFGAVFRARQLGIDRIVAVKCLLQEAGSVDETAIERFKREGKLSSALEHPNTITIHDYGQTETGVFYLVMEYVRGVTLKAALRKETRLEADRAVRITKQVLYSLQEAHSRGIVHRDMKPANIMLFNRLGEKDVVKVLDFGIAKFVTNDGAAMGEAKEDLTVAGRIIGTPRYMAPEQINGKGAFPASDIYGLGLIFYEMLTGKQAVIGDSTLTLIAQQISNTPIINPDDPAIPTTLRPVLAKATDKNMLGRFQTAAEFLQALDAVDNRELVNWVVDNSLDRSGDRSLDRPVPPTVTGEYKSVERPDGTLDPTRNARPVPPTPAAEATVASPVRWGIIAAVGALILGLAGVGIGIGLSGEDTTPALANSGAGMKVEDKAGTDGTARVDAPPVADDQADATPADREITIQSDPPGAAVTRNGENLGQTPLTVKLTGDEKSAIELALEGYEKETIDLAPDSEPEVKVALKGIVPDNAKPTQAVNDSRPKVVKPNNTASKGDKTGGKDPKGKDPKGGSGSDYEVF